MSLIFRTDLSRPLTHEELDSNFKFVYVKPWEYGDYTTNMLSWIKGSDGITRIYACVNSHVRYTYDPSKQFAVTVTLNDSVVVLWQEIANTGGNNTGGDAFYNPDLPDALQTPEKVGGIVAGTTVGDLRNKSYTDLWNRLLFPSIAPTFVNPSISIASTVTGLQEIGSVVSLTISAGAYKGAILQPWDGNSTQASRAGDPQWYDFALDGVDLPGGTQSANNFATLDGLVVTQGLHTESAQVKFLAGPQPVDNYGQPSGSVYPSTSLSTTTSYEGVYPLFATTVVNPTLTKQPLYSMISGNNIEFMLAAELNTTDRQTFAIPQAWLSARPLLGVYYFNTISGTYSTENKIGEFATSTITQTINGSLVTYTKYTYNALMRGEMKVKLVF